MARFGGEAHFLLMVICAVERISSTNSLISLAVPRSFHNSTALPGASAKATPLSDTQECYGLSASLVSGPITIFTIFPKDFITNLQIWFSLNTAISAAHARPIDNVLGCPHVALRRNKNHIAGNRGAGYCHRGGGGRNHIFIFDQRGRPFFCEGCFWAIQSNREKWDFVGLACRCPASGADRRPPKGALRPLRATQRHNGRQV